MVPDATQVDPVAVPMTIQAPPGMLAGADAYGPTLITDATQAAAGSPDPELSVCLLAEYGLISVLGPDARKFLNAQSTNDVLVLADDALQLDGYCTPKGRLLASFVEWPVADGIHLAIARELAAPIAKRLSMYVFRSKLKVRDESDSWYALGLQGAGLSRLMARLGVGMPQPWKLQRKAHWTALGLPDLASKSSTPGVRVMLWIPATDLQQVLGLVNQPLGDSQAWRAAEIEAGLPRIVPASSELFVPQMVNFDLINAVNFKKGCYPGQEIVARSQYLGKLKRRMLKGSAALLAAPGDDVLAPGTTPGTLDAVGKVVMSAMKPGSPGRFSLLMELQLTHAQANDLTVGGSAIALEALPYDVPLEKTA